MKKIILISILLLTSQLFAFSDSGLVYKNRETVVQLLKNGEVDYRELDDVYKRDREIVLISIDNTPYVLEYLNDNFKKDKKIVKKAISQEGSLLQYANKSLQKERELIDLALEASGYGLQYLSEKERDNKAFVLKIIKKNPYALEHVSARLKKDKELAFKLFKELVDDEEECDGEGEENIENERDFIFQFIDKELFKNKAFVMKLLQLYPQYGFLLSKELQKDKEIKALLIYDDEEINSVEEANLSQLGRKEAFKILKEEPWRYDELNSTLKKDKELTTLVVKDSPHMLRYADETLKKDRDFILFLIKENLSIFEYLDESFRNDKKIVLPILKQNSYYINYVGKKLKKDNAFMLSIFQESGEGFEYLNAHQKKDKALVKKAVEKYGYYFQYADKQLRDDKPFVLELMKSVENDIYDDVSERLKKDKEVILASLKHGGFYRLDGVERALLKDEKFIEEAIKQNGYSFKYATKEQQSNRALVKNALKLNASAFQYVNKKFRKDKAFILELLKEKIDVFSYVDESLEKDREFVIKAVTIDGSVLSSLDDSFRKDKEIVELALTQTACAICAVDESLTNDANYTLHLVKTTGAGFEYLSEKQKHDRALILEILSTQGSVYNNLSKKQKQDKEFIETALSSYGWVLDDLSDNLKRDRALIKIALNRNGWIIQSVPKPLNRNREILLTALRENGLALEYVDKDLRQNREYVLTALREEPKALIFVDNALRTNKEFLIEAINTPELFKYMDKSLLEEKAFMKQLKEVTGFTPENQKVKKEAKKKEFISCESMTDVNLSSLKTMSYKRYEDYAMHEGGWSSSSDITKNQKYIVSMLNQSIAIWDINSSLLVRQIDINKSIRTLNLVDESKSVLTKSSYEIEIWDLETGVLKATIFKGKSYISEIELSPNRKWLAFLSDNMMYVCNVKSRKIVQKFKVDKEYISRFTIDNSGKYLAIGKERSYEITLWDVKSAKVTATLWGHSETVYHLIFSPNHKYLVTANFNGYIKIWDIKSKKLLRTLKKEKHIDSLDISKDGNCLLSTSNKLKLWNLKTGELINSAPNSKGSNNTRFINNEKSILLNDDYSVHIRDINSFKVLHEAKNLKRLSYVIRFTPKRRYMVQAFRSSKKTKVALWDIANNKLLKVIKCNNKQSISSLEVSRDGKYLFMAFGWWEGGGDNIYVQMWDIEQNRLVKTFKNKDKNSQERQNIFDIALSPNGKYFATFLNTGEVGKNGVEVWSVESGKLIGLFPDIAGGRVRPIMTISQDSKSLILGDDKGGINFYDIKSKKLIKRVQISKQSIGNIATFDTDKLLIASGSKVYLRSLSQEKNLKTFNIGKKVVFEIIISDNNKVFVLDYMSEGLEAWSIDKEKPIFSSDIDTYYNNMGSIIDLSHDAKEIVVALDDGSVKIYSLDNLEKANKIFVFGDKKNWVVFDEVNKTMHLVDEGSFLLKKHEVAKDENRTLFEFERLNL